MDSNDTNGFSYDEMEDSNDECERKAGQESLVEEKVQDDYHSVDEWAKRVENNKKFLDSLGFHFFERYEEIDNLFLKLAFEHRSISSSLREAIVERIFNSETTHYFLCRIDAYNHLYDGEQLTYVTVLGKHQYKEMVKNVKKMTAKFGKYREMIADYESRLKNLKGGKKKKVISKQVLRCLLRSVKRDDGLLTDFNVWSPKGVRNAIAFFQAFGVVVSKKVIDRYRDDERFKDFVDAVTEYNAGRIKIDVADDDEDDDEDDEDENQR